MCYRANSIVRLLAMAVCNDSQSEICPVLVSVMSRTASYNINVSLKSGTKNPQKMTVN